MESYTGSSAWSAKDIALLESSFGRIHGRLPAHVAGFYALLFERRPDFRALFTGDPAAQARKLSVALSSIVVSVRAPEMMASSLDWLRDRHAGAGVSAEDFGPFIEVLVEALEAAHGDGWSAEIEALWRRGLNQVASVLKHGAHRVDARPARVDTDLSARTIRIVQSSYPRLMADVTLFYRFYRRLFRRYPHYRRLFNSDPATQQRKLSVALASVVSNLSSPVPRLAMFREIGRRHREAGVTSADFEPFLDVICACFAESLNVPTDDELVLGWRAAFERVAAVMTEDG